MYVVHLLSNLQAMLSQVSIILILEIDTMGIILNFYTGDLTP